MRALRTLFTIAVVGLGLTACQDSAIDLSSKTASSIRVGASVPVAIQSIEGLPGDLSARFSSAFAAEAQTRDIAFVDAAQKPRFRLKGYVDAFRADDGNTVSWVFDVFDGRSSRAQRVSGSQRIGGSGDAWNSVDDKVLRYVAARSLEDIGAFLLANRQEPAAVPVASKKQSEKDEASAE